MSIENREPETARPDVEPDPERLRAEIAGTRVDLGETVEALVAKLDLPRQAREKAADTAGAARRFYRHNRPVVIGAGLGAIVVVSALTIGLRLRGRNGR